MASLVSRLVACLVAVVAVLQLVHLVLLNKLETRRLTELQQLQQQQQQPPGISPLQGKDHPHLDSIINGPERLVQSGLDDAVVENEKLAARLSAEHEGTIVDSTGEFRIVFDIAGSRPTADNGANPRPFTKQQQNQPPPPPPQHQLQLEHLTDDFSIDEEAVSDTIDVTLVTQGDLTNARAYLVQLTERWQGPISLALFARNSSQVDASLQFIAQIRQCHDLSRQYVSFHLVFPLVEKSEVGKKPFKNRRKILKVSSLLSSSSSSSSPSSSRQRFDPKVCQKFRDQIIKSKKQLESNNLNYDDRVYPVNLLRNVAKKRVMTEFSLVTDIDMLPSAGLRSKFQKFAQNKQLDKSDGDERKSVFVVPAFESKNGEAPRTKKELLNLIEKYQVRPFYFDLCWKCQVHTDYETWQREPESRTGDLTVLFEVLWKDPWEPFFIADNSLPSFDERFRQYGFNRLSQLCELHVAGYKFAVLNDAFLIHQGYKTLQSFHPGRSRDVENNRVNFRQFKFELKDKYPHSTRRCY